MSKSELAAVIERLTNIGNVLRLMRDVAITADVVAAAERNKPEGVLLGEHLRTMHVITAEQLDRALVFQRRLREARDAQDIERARAIIEEMRDEECSGARMRAVARLEA